MKNDKMLFSVLVAALSPAALMAQAILSSVPMQGQMLMPRVAYHADTETVTVDLSTIHEPAQLTPLLVSHPTHCFDAVDPWFDALDPSRQGLAFSRRYGFTPDPLTDLLPAGREIWIRKLSGPAELSFYSCSATPSEWTPIFGTAGASTNFYWSGAMFHPCVTAPPGTNEYAATFEAHLVDTATGKEMAGSSSGPFVLNWTDVPDGRPELEITSTAANQKIISWPATATNWSLFSATRPDSTGWIGVTNIPAPHNDRLAVWLDAAETSRFFRMKLLR